MVSKVAVIALVAIIAVPILLGFGMNFNETTKVVYEQGESTNVTDYITQDTHYSYMNMNVYEINTMNFALDFSSGILHYFDRYVLPNYQTTSSRTALPMDITVTNTPSAVADLTDYQYYQLTTTYDFDRPNDFQLGVRVYQPGIGWSNYANRVSLVTWNPDNQSVYVVYHVNTNQTVNFTWLGATKLEYQYVNYTADATIMSSPVSGVTSTSADLTSGYTLTHYGSLYNYNDTRDNNWWVPSAVVSSALFTIDLSTLTDSLTFNTWTDDNNNTTITLNRITSGSDVQWYVNNILDNRLVYDTSASENVYQFEFTHKGVNIYYVGSWPSTLGLANYYRDWSIDWTTPLVYDENFKGIQIDTQGDYPKMRVDGAQGLASVFDAIIDQTYDPVQLIGSSNISTTIKSVSYYGDSITFGGQTYNVKNRSLELGTHDVSLFNMTFESVINANSTYDNKINGNTISTTANPSTLTFNGVWVANVESAPLVTNTVTETEWIPGEFAWDGMDDNFLMVGLLTSLAAFIGLGIYSRKARFSVWPLMIVTGGAAFLFLILM